MSEPAPEAPATETPEPTEPEQQPKPTETVEFWRDKAREQEKRAKANADAAKRLADIEDAQKTDAEKAAGKIAELEQQLTEAHTSTLRFKVASKYGISEDDADLFLTASDEETLIKQAERLGAKADERKRTGNFAPLEGINPTSTGDQSDLAFARQLFSPRE